MLRPRTAALIGGPVLCALAVAGCKSATTPSGTHSAEARAGASASAFATNPAIQGDEVRALRKLAACSPAASHGQLTFTVIKTTAGQAQIPGTTTPKYPHIKITHWSPLLLHHLGKTTDAAVNCAAAAGSVASAKACVVHLSRPTSKAAISAYMVGVANCMVGAPQ